MIIEPETIVTRDTTPVFLSDLTVRLDSTTVHLSEVLRGGTENINQVEQELPEINSEEQVATVDTVTQDPQSTLVS